MITHLEPGIPECEVKWALGSIITNKASGGDGIPVELFQILKDDPVAQMVENLPAVWATQVQFLGWEDALTKEMAAHSSILPWKIPWTEEPCRL